MKQKLSILIPFISIAILLAYTWAVILSTELHATWRHYTALFLFISIGALFIKQIKKLVLTTGIYLILAIFNLLALTPSINSTSLFINIGSAQISTPSISLLSLSLFILYFILNLDTLINMRLDYKEAKQHKAQQ